ncbi:ribosome silencing factor [Tumidithrix elongata RA019]|uniref:Ribosomal silencing factor RsfS n=1 Tax=Tumidithrix elongata BACA0141 TaxID=2716417 RepID=A0AAW9QAM7_9CYAN|nr:ribosome silencing factor [Tumidithrix elongata RA019]
MTSESISVLQPQDPSLLSQDLAYQMTMTAATVADDRKAEDILILAIGEVSVLAEYFVIATGFSKAQVRAIANAIEGKLAEDFNRVPRRTAGESEATWILQDYGDVMVHIMMPTERKTYELEAFWGHAPKVALPEKQLVEQLTNS